VIQDDVDTVRVVMRENLRTELQEARVEAGERLEVVIAPSEHMSNPVLALWCDVDGADVVVEQVACGHFIVVACPEPIAAYAQGREIRETVSAADPLRVLIRNQDECRVKVRVTLAVLERPGTYKILNKEG
jgi:hypothetical protein